ncbi:hypothetical protein Tco_0712097, partial [Tanacetum coccineum]
KKFSVNVEVFRDILNICPRIQDQGFNEPSTEEEALSFIRELGHSGEIKYITIVIVDHIHQPWRTFASIINKCLCGKKSAKGKKVASTKPKPTKKKALVKADKGKGDGTDFESGVPDEQHHKTSGTDEGISTKLGVPSVPKYDSKSEKESWGDSEEEDDDDENDSKDESNDSDDDDDDDANDDGNQEDDDMNDDDEETDKEEKKINDEEMIDEEEDDEVTKEMYNDSGFEQVEEDAHVSLTLVLDTQKTDELVQSSSVSSDFTSKLLNLENPSLAENEIVSLMDTTIRHEEPRSQTSTLYIVPIMYAQALSSIPAIVDCYIDNKLGEAIQKAIVAHNLDCREEAQAEKRDYIELVDISIRVILKDEVNTQLLQILPKAVLDFATLVIEKNVTKSLEAAVLARSSCQPKSTYEAAASFSEFELTKILIDKMEKNKSYDKADYKRELYDALVKSYQTDKDLFDTCVQQDQEFDTGNNDEQPADKVVSKDDWFKKPKRPPTPNSDWNKRQHVDFQPPQTWISQVSHDKEPPTSFDELMDTSFDIFAFVLNRLNIKDLTQEILVRLAVELLKGTYKSLTELKYHLEECSKATTE